MMEVYQCEESKKPGSSAATDNPGKRPDGSFSLFLRGKPTHKGVNFSMQGNTNMINAHNVNTHISTQRLKILSHLKDGEPITSLDALQRYGCMRLASRISELKRKGIPIKSRFIRTEKGKQVKEYWLECA